MQARELSFSLNPLDPNFVPPKPLHSVKESVVADLERRSNLVITRKQDGYGTLAVVLRDTVHLYTRGIDEVTPNYPHVAKNLNGFCQPNTLLQGEMLFDDAGKDNFELLTKIAKSSPDSAIRLQEKIGFAKFMAFNLIVYDSLEYVSLPYSQRLETLQSFFRSQTEYILPVQVINQPFIQAKSMVVSNGWEGLVLYDKTKPSEFRLDGNTANPPRPIGCWKWKPLLEDDFIVRKFAFGEGRNTGRMGKLFLSQIDPKTGKEVSCGEVGIGFSDSDREYFVKTAYPLVVQVKFEKRFASGALRHPRFMRLREDKKPQECIASL